jgi:peptidoglycan/xylan/chitin deacetylase (PgdA/CDA1 family)
VTVTLPAPASFRTAAAPGWPVVLYFHHVHPSLEHYTSVTADALRFGLDLVLDGFQPVALDDVLAADGTIDRPDRPATLITFDDGYADVLDEVPVILAERNIRATFFVCTGLLGRASTDPRENHLSWADCADLAAAGHTIASHGRTHRAIDELPPAEAAAEVAGSLSALRSRLAVTRAAYAYPYGRQAPVPDTVADFSGPVTAFGTVKAAARPWPDDRTAVRRTYLPSGEEDTWRELVAHWRHEWERQP